jgi:hypothetical protein
VNKVIQLVELHMGLPLTSQKVLSSWLIAEVRSDTGSSTTSNVKGGTSQALQARCLPLNHNASQFTSLGPGAG